MFDDFLLEYDPLWEVPNIQILPASQRGSLRSIPDKYVQYLGPFN
jgi:hypothetical protein